MNRASLIRAGAGAMATLLLISSRAGAQPEEDPAPTWTVQIDPLTAALGFAHVQLERSFGRHASLYLGPSIRLYDPLADSDEPSYRGFGAEAGLRWYIHGTAPRGWWLLARGVLAHLRADLDDPNADDTSTGWYTSALAGYTWIFDHRWVLSGGLGISYFGYEVAGVGVDGFLPAAHTTLGLAF